MTQSCPLGDWRKRCRWEENALFPVFEDLAAERAGATTGHLKREHRRLDSLAEIEDWTNFTNLVSQTERRKALIYNFVETQAERFGWSLEELLQAFWKRPVEPRPPFRLPDLEDR